MKNCHTRAVHFRSDNCNDYFTARIFGQVFTEAKTYQTILKNEKKYYIQYVFFTTLIVLKTSE
jgi:hypothetical protein